MRDPLDISFPSTKGYSIYASAKVEAAGKTMLSLKGLEKQIEYYNRNICSLSFGYNPEGLHCFGEYDDWHGFGQVFLKKQPAKEDEGFDIYLKQRQKEIDRIRRRLSQQHTYLEKLGCFIEEKAGQPRLEELKVESNEWVLFLANGAGRTPEHLWDGHTVTDLSPNTPEEIEQYNGYLRRHIEEMITSPDRFHWLIRHIYRGFDAATGIKVFSNQLERALNRENAINNELRRIEAKFQYGSLLNYVELLYPYSVDNTHTWQSAIFNALVNGYRYDSSRRRLKLDEMEALIHIEQVYSYYSYLFGLKKLPVVVEPVKSYDGDDWMKPILDRTELKDFLSVPAPDITYENAVWHDLNGQPVDCNIYHHRYGYTGFDADTDDEVVTSFNPTIYKDESTGRFVYCKDHLPMLCTEDENRFFNKDGIEIVKVPFTLHNQKRLATGEIDFRLIIEREFTGQKLVDTPNVRSTFYEELAGHVEQLMQLHKQNSTYREGREIDVLALAKRFIKFLQMLKQKKADSNGLSKTVLGLFCRLVNDAGIHAKHEWETMEHYCQRICTHYHFSYTTRVRQCFNEVGIRKNRQKLIEQIFPLIPADDRNILAAWLEKN
jgi:hypothetical protein